MAKNLIVYDARKGQNHVNVKKDTVAEWAKKCV